MAPGSNPAILTEAVCDLLQFLRDNAGHRRDYEAKVSVHNLPNHQSQSSCRERCVVWATDSVITKKKEEKLNGAFKLPVDVNDANLFLENIYTVKKNTEAV